MRIAEDPQTVRWLTNLAGVADSFDWDAGNRTKNAKHGVHVGDIEDLLRGATVFVGRIIEPIHDEPRWLLLGEDASGRRLALIFTRRGDRIRPVSCRPMRPKEKEVYEEGCQEDRC